ncbi:hypothetical protein ACJX0J_004591 (mitochondrion) [Zea mays]
MSIELSDIARQPQRTSNLDQPKYSVISYSSQWKNDHRFADCFHSSSLASLYLIEKKCAFCAILKKLYLKEKEMEVDERLFRFYSFLIAEVLVITAKKTFFFRRLIEQEVGNDLSGSNLFDLITKCQYRITENN